MNSKQTIAVIHPNENAYSETFIRAHIQRLPARIIELNGGWFPNNIPGQGSLLEAKGVRWFCRVLESHLLGRSKTVLQQNALREFLLKEQVDAVLAEYGPTGVAVAPVCLAAGIPLIVHFHGFDAYCHSVLEQYGDAYMGMFQNAALLVAVSRDMVRQLKRLGATDDKILLNPYGVDTALFQPRKDDSTDPLFIAVGRFVDKKAPYLTILAFQHVLRESSNSSLVFVGDGVLMETCRHLTKALGLQDSVRFVGSQSHDKVAWWMAQARAYVQHSVCTADGDSEGTPVSIIEAGATALPVVSTCHGGIMDVVVDGESGFLVEEGDVAGMGRQMLRLALDRSLALRMGANARRRIEEQFSMDQRIAALWRAIESVIETNV